MFARILEILFPRYCLGCKRRGTYLCEDCLSLIDLYSHPFSEPPLLFLYSITYYQHFLIKRLIHSFKYWPFAHDLRHAFRSLILTYLKNLENTPYFVSHPKTFIIVPIPLHLSRQKWRGFNQAEILAQELAYHLKIPVSNNVLVKTKATRPQAELTGKKRKENIKGVFKIINPEKIKGKNILLVDDIYTTGTTMKRAAKILKENGAKEIIGLVIARD